jgi:hypothetical protein
LEIQSQFFFFIYDFIFHTAYTVDACAFISILPSLSLINMIYCTADTIATPASVQGIGVDFYIDKDATHPQRCAPFLCVFGRRDGYGV